MLGATRAGQRFANSGSGGPLRDGRSLRWAWRLGNEGTIGESRPSEAVGYAAHDADYN